MTSAYSPQSLDQLPTEILSRIISQLDHYSVMAMIDAFPGFKKKTAIVTDHNLPPLFFNVKGVQRLYLDDGKRQPDDGYTLYKKSRDHYLITLVEFINSEPQRRLFQSDPASSEVTLNSTTFLFGRICDWLPPKAWNTRQLAQDFFSKYPNVQAKIHVGTYIWYHGQDTVDEYIAAVAESDSYYPKLETRATTGEHVFDFPHRTRQLDQKALLSWAITLTVECSKSFSHCHFPNLKSLTVLFRTEPWRIPVIADIYAPFLSHFVVHYNHRRPIFCRVYEIATGKGFEERWRRGAKPENVMAHYNSGLSLSPCYPPTKLTQEQRKLVVERLYFSHYYGRVLEIVHTGSLVNNAWSRPGERAIIRLSRDTRYKRDTPYKRDIHYKRDISDLFTQRFLRKIFIDNSCCTTDRAHPHGYHL